jgi:hypothetical protein
MYLQEGPRGWAALRVRPENFNALVHVGIIRVGTAPDVQQQVDSRRENRSLLKIKFGHDTIPSFASEA